MKKLILPLAAISITLLAIIWHKNLHVQKNKALPKPTRTVVFENDEGNEQELRKQWIDLMHKAGPGVNWRTENYNNRVQKQKNYSNSKGTTSYVSIAGGLLTGNWRETGSRNLAGRTHFVEYDFQEDSIYLASSGGNIWKASKNGLGWRILNDFFKIDDIKMIRKIDHYSGKRLLVANGGWGVPGFFYSDNDGISWTASSGLSSIANWGSVIRTIVVNNSNKTIYLLAMEWDYSNWEKKTSIYVSENHGQSFTNIHSFLESEYGNEGNFDIWSAQNGAETIYLLENNNLSIINSDYSLSSVSSISYSMPGSVLLEGTEISGLTTLYIAVSESGQTTFYKSDNAGLSFTTKGTVEETPFFKNSFEISATNSNTLYFGGVECYKSSDGGQTFTKLNNWWDYYDNMPARLHADIPGINSYRDSEGNEFVYINTDGGTYISNNQLNTVQNISLENLNVGQLYSVYSHRTNENVIFAGSQDQGYQLCVANSGIATEDFVQVVSGDYGHIVSSDGGNSVWMVYPGFAAYYPEAVTNPEFSDWWDFVCSGQFWIPPLMADPDYPNRVYLGGGTSTAGTHLFLLTSFSGWINHSELPYDFSGNSGSSSISAIAYSTINTDYRYVMNGNGDFFTSTDGGTTWVETAGFDGPDGNYLYGAAIVPSKTSLGTVYVAGSGYSNPGAFVSINNGNSFTEITSGLPGTMTYELAITDNDEMLFAATDIGPYVYITSENQWYDLGDGSAPDQVYWTVDYNPSNKTVRFGTYGRGIWDFVIENGLVNNNELLTENQPFAFPNPTNDFITINAEPGSAITLYNLKGEVILKTQISNFNQKIDISGITPGIYILSSKNKKSKMVFY
ncbi:MAG: T9SS type A sorting domain-containing protein [Bacteroidales bacterium]|nr:T9SS type A sorting domain-containing protein [Bacteroidales bacterium]